MEANASIIFLLDTLFRPEVNLIGTVGLSSLLVIVDTIWQSNSNMPYFLTHIIWF